MLNRALPVAVFDSGVGGISVLRELVRQMPSERFVYYGDTANAPYGDKPAAEVRRLTLESFRLLGETGFKAAVVACNTATSAAIGSLRSAFPDIPVIGIEPALKPAADRCPGGTVMVLATDTTLHEEKFAALTGRFGSSAAIVKLPCPGLMEFVERGELSGAPLDAYLEGLFRGYDLARVDAVVLGCTHYPFVLPALRRFFPQKTVFFDGSAGTAKETLRRLKQTGLLRTEGEGSVEFRSSGGGEAFAELCRSLLAISLDSAEAL